MKSERTPQRLHPQEFFLDNNGFPFFRLPEEALAELKPSAMNRSTNSHILIYNRVIIFSFFFRRTLLQVPKCGSTTIGGVLKSLSVQNNFSVITSRNAWRFSSAFSSYDLLTTFKFTWFRILVLKGTLDFLFTYQLIVRPARCSAPQRRRNL